MIPKITNRKTLRTIGLAALALGSASHLLLQRVAPATETLSDGLWGFLLAIAIGCLLLSMRSANRECSK